MNGAHILRAEDVGEVGRDGGEAPAIHRRDQAEGRSKQSEHAEVGKGRRRGIAEEAQGEEGEIGRLTPDLVGERCPDEPAGDIDSENSPTKAAPTSAACAFCASLN